MERIEKLQAEIKSLEARYASETDREAKDCIGAALDAWRIMLMHLRA